METSENLWINLQKFNSGGQPIAKTIKIPLSLFYLKRKRKKEKKRKSSSYFISLKVKKEKNEGPLLNAAQQNRVWSRF